MKTTIKAKNKKHLLKIIEEAIEEDGPECDLNHIDVSKIRDMSSLFFLSHFNGDISKWDVSRIKNMGWMFHGAMFNGDISAWNVSRVEIMASIFSQSEFKGDVSNWNVRKVTRLIGAFSDCPENVQPYWAKIEDYHERIAAVEAYQQKQQLDKFIVLDTSKDKVLKI